jgi:hypothetical protein
MLVPQNDKSVEKPCGWQLRHADIGFKSLLPRQPAQALPDLWKTRLVHFCSRRESLGVYARERWRAQDQSPWRRDLYS